MVTELRVVQFWSEITLVISNKTSTARSFDFEITRMISDQIALHSVQLPLFIYNHTFNETNFKPKLFTANVECNGTVIKLPETEKPILFLNLNSCSMVVNGGELVFWFTFNLAVHFRPKMTLFLRIALATHVSSSSLVLGSLNLPFAICFVKQRGRSELTNS